MPLSADPHDEQLQFAAQSLEKDTHFVKALTDAADKREVIARSDIYSSSGMKLVSSGTRLTGRFYDRLVEHKLLTPLEQSLGVSGAVDAAQLFALLKAQVAGIPLLAAQFDRAASRRQLEGLFGRLKIPAPLGLKLSVAQEERPVLFRHLLNTAIMACLLAIEDRLPEDDARALIVAAALHDLGELSIDPALLEEGYRTTPEERRHLYAHPLTGFLILRDFAEIPAAAKQAILQHHEAVDGSGYPYRRRGDQLGRVARYLSVSDVAASLLVRFGADKRICMLLRLTRQKYDAPALNAIGRVFCAADAPVGEAPDLAAATVRLSQASLLFEAWDALRQRLAEWPASESVAADYLVERVNNLRMTLADAGFDPSGFDAMPALANGDDPEVCVELKLVLDELEWQFKALGREIERNRYARRAQRPLAVSGIFDNWLGQVRQFVGE
jgi:HD-GYP domain-containing protein (c-di-GMP phosphodiesterase class II)